MKCPLCPEKFDVVVGIDMHIRTDHPGAAEANREIVNRLYRAERAQQRVERLAKVGKVSPGLRSLLHHCPCGKKYEDHESIKQERAGVPT